MLAVFSVALLGCTSSRHGVAPPQGGTDSPTAGASGAVPTISGHTYRVESISSDGVDVPLVTGTNPTIRFDTRTVSIESGCNTIGGNYTIAGSTLTVSNAGGTVVGCDAARTTQEHLLSSLTLGTSTVATRGEQLTFTAGAVAITAR
jgi:heat shock protein HslJ